MSDGFECKDRLGGAPWSIDSYRSFADDCRELPEPRRTHMLLRLWETLRFVGTPEALALAKQVAHDFNVAAVKAAAQVRVRVLNERPHSSEARAIANTMIASLQQHAAEGDEGAQGLLDALNRRPRRARA